MTKELSLKVDEEIVLETLRLCDARELFALVDVNRGYLGRWLDWIDGTKSADDSKKFIRGSRQKRFAGQKLEFGIWWNGELVGVVGLFISQEHRRGEIGYWLAEDAQHKGIMRRCVRLLTRYGFQELKFNKVWLCVAVGNVASNNVARKLGFHDEGIQREHMLTDGRYRDMRNWGMLRREWHDGQLG